MADPILKWAGGKRQILPRILDHFKDEDDYESYHEPFFGGGAVFFRETHEDAATVNDINPRLVNFYSVLQEDVPGLLDELDKLRSRMPEDDPNPDWDHDEEDQHDREIKNYYYQVRALFNKRPNNQDYDKTREAAMFLWLNRTCFNGLYRENRSGEFNVPIGNHKSLGLDMDSKLQEASDALSGVEILCEDFGYILDKAEEDDLVYFDPPYDPQSSSSSFVEYTSESFGKDEQRRLSDVALELDERGVNVVISNAPSVTDLYETDRMANFDYSEIGARRAINSDGDSRGEVEEVIITNIDKEDRRSQHTHIPDYN